MNNLLTKILIVFSCILSLSAEDLKFEVLVSSDNRIYEQGIYGIQTVLEQEINITYLDIINQNETSLSEYFQKIESSNLPFLITIGAPATRIAKDTLKEKNILFSMVSSPKSLGLDSSKICGLSMDVPISEIFSHIKEINPEIKNIYTFYSTSEGEYFAKEGEISDLKKKVLFYSKKIENKEEFGKELNELKSLQAFVMINDPLYGKKEFETLSEYAKKNKLILTTNFPSLVKYGATFAITPNFTKIGILTGEMANRIYYKKSSCKDEFIQYPDQYSFYLNEEYARESGIEIPAQIKERAKLSGLLEAGITLMNENKVKSAKIIFDTITEKDPSNKAALMYQQLLLEKISGEKIKELFKNADTYYEQKQFLKAKAEYQKILQINPKINRASEGITKSIQSLSEQERLQGMATYQKGDRFTAVKLLLSSLRTLPSNSMAQSDLNALRSKETASMRDYINEGIRYYNSREYEIAIDIFEGALLIIPGDKIATEYLRLSLKKRDAIIVLKNKLNK